MQQRTIIVLTVAGLVVLAGVGVAVAASTSTPGVAPVASTSQNATAEPSAGSDSLATPAPDAAPHDTIATLLYLIEEEKLAHDVYVTLGALWGTSVFTNIAESETTHQDLVAPLLDARGIPDPRSTEVGVFTDPALQSLYDELVARGSTSLEEAIQVGIIIEETDITDLSAAIASEDETDVVGVLERLLSGSENHLQSFQRLA